MSQLPNGWEIDTLEKLTTKIGDGLHGTPKYVEKSEYYFINGNNLNGKNIEINDNNKCVSEKEYIKNKKALDNTTILLSINGTIGSLAYYNNEKVMLGKSVAYINVNNKILKQFLFYLLNSSKIMRCISLELTGTTIKNLSLKTIRNTKVIFPPLKEQKKIADILSTVDQKIAFVEDNISQTQELKKGLMQKLLTEGIGHAEFKDSEIGRIPESWQVQIIEDFATVVTGGKDTQDRIDNGTYPFYVRSNTIERINTFSFEGEAVLTSGDGVGVGKIFHYVNEKFDYHQRVYNIHNFNTNMYGKFFYEYFKAHFYSRVSRLSAKNSVDSVRRDMITKMKVPVPPLEEQKQIAEILSTVDQKLEVLKDKKGFFQELKKGLMQKLLTGEVRV